MSRYHSYINSAVQILEGYDGRIPLGSFLKNFFSSDKKFGSADRKQITHLCYCYFRLGKAAGKFSKEEGILTGLLICSTERNPILSAIRPGWNERVSEALTKKIVSAGLSLPEVFPWREAISEGIEYENFCSSFFRQPDLFLRIRPGHKGDVLKKLKEAALDYELSDEDCIRLPNNSKVEAVLAINKEVVVQDLSSQQTGIILKNQKPKTINHKLKIWDCCAASGGKSIMLYDLLSNTELTVSDIRESILRNLKKRFTEAGIKNYHSFTADLTGSPPVIKNSPFDIIIADVPCSGSGTWSRTPEQLFYFDIHKAGEYASLQKKIVTKVIPFLKPDGLFVYITCSVFRKENEEVVEYILKNSTLLLKEKRMINGYRHKADALFIAVFTS